MPKKKEEAVNVAVEPGTVFPEATPLMSPAEVVRADVNGLLEYLEPLAECEKVRWHLRQAVAAIGDVEMTVAADVERAMAAEVTDGES